MSNDRLTVQLIVIGLVLVALSVVVGAVYLIAVGRTVPDGLWTLAGGATGAIAALLARTATEPTVAATAIPVRTTPPA